MAGEVFHDSKNAVLELSGQHLLDVCLESVPIDEAIEHPRCGEAPES